MLHNTKITLDKKLIRKEFLIKRNSLAKELKDSMDIKIRDKVCHFIKENNFNKIALYYPIGSEIDLLPIIDVFRDKFFLLPYIQSKDSHLIFREYKINDELLASNVLDTILEPSHKKPSFIPDLVLVPLVCYDKFFYRLGYGKGFYDRTIDYLEKLNNDIVFVGVAYSFLYYDKSLPIDKFDKKLHLIINEC